MKKLLLALLALGAVACSKVPAGNVGVKVYLLGSSKGVDHETLGPGRYFIGYNEELYLFPTFKQNHTWTQESTHESPGDESITMQTREGLVMNADVGIMYSIKPENVAKVFQSYRRGIDEVTHTFLRNVVRDAFNQVAAVMEAEAIYGYGKNKFQEDVENRVRQSVEPLGIDVEKIYLVGNLRLPPAVTNAIDAKLQAMQLATQRENELRQAEAEAKKVQAAAQGEANATLLRAKAEAAGNEARAAANVALAKSLTHELVEYERVKKWDGALPKYQGNGSLFSFKEGT